METERKRNDEVTNFKIKPIESFRETISSVIPFMPYLVFIFFIFFLFLTNLRVNCCINRAFGLKPNMLAFYIDRRVKNITLKNTPEIKRQFQEVVDFDTNIDKYMSQEDIKNIISKIVEYNKKLPKEIYVENEIEENSADDIDIFSQYYEDN